MAKDPTTRQLSDKHAEYIEQLTGARVTRGSGNQVVEPMDNRMTVTRYTPIAFAFEGKATRNRSVSVKLDEWEKAIEQAGDLRPAMAFRFYASDNRLTPLRDMIMISADDFAELLDKANNHDEMRDR